MSIILQADKGTLLTAAEADNNIQELRDGTGAVTPNAQATTGVKVGDYNTADYGWHDLTGNLDTDPDDPNRANWASFRNGIRALQFATVNAEAHARFHIPHDYKMGTDMFIHAHWAHNSSTLTGGSVTWGFECTHAKGFDQGAFPATKTVTVLQNANLAAYQHMVAETALSVSGGSGTQLDTDDLEVDGLILCRFFLDSNDLTDSVSPPDPFCFFVDIHYQSTNVATKNRNPDFWT